MLFCMFHANCSRSAHPSQHNLVTQGAIARTVSSLWPPATSRGCDERRQRWAWGHGLAVTRSTVEAECVQHRLECAGIGCGKRGGWGNHEDEIGGGTVVHFKRAQRHLRFGVATYL